MRKKRPFPFGGGPAPLVNIDIGGLQGARAGSPASLMGVFFARTGVDCLRFLSRAPLPRTAHCKIAHAESRARRESRTIHAFTDAGGRRHEGPGHPAGLTF